MPTLVTLPERPLKLRSPVIPLVVASTTTAPRPVPAASASAGNGDPDHDSRQDKTYQDGSDVHHEHLPSEHLRCRVTSGIAGLSLLARRGAGSGQRLSPAAAAPGS